MERSSHQNESANLQSTKSKITSTTKSVSFTDLRAALRIGRTLLPSKPARLARIEHIDGRMIQALRRVPHTPLSQHTHTALRCRLSPAHSAPLFAHRQTAVIARDTLTITPLQPLTRARRLARRPMRTAQLTLARIRIPKLVLPTLTYTATAARTLARTVCLAPLSRRRTARLNHISLDRTRRLEVIRARRVPPHALQARRAIHINHRTVARALSQKQQRTQPIPAVYARAVAFARVLPAAAKQHIISVLRKHLHIRARRR